MNNKIARIILLFLLITSLFSCVTQKDLTYLQYSSLPEITKLPVREHKISVTPSSYKLMSYDILYIRVITIDPQWSQIFNATPSGSSSQITEESAQLLGYPIDNNGEIEIPFIGKVQAAGKTLSELKTILDSVIKKYVSDAAITVRLVNNFVSVIGEVAAPGRYPINKDLLNIFEVLSAAGDISLYGNRQKVQLIRPSAFAPIIKEFSLKDKNILTSEYYYVMPNDIVYVPPMKGKTFQNNASIYTLFLTTITTALVILGFFNPR